MNVYQELKLLHRAFRYARRTEPNEIAIVRKLIRRGDSVIDIGAHKAAFAFWMARGVGPQGSVACFEPIPDLASYLRKVATRYRDGRMTLVESALSDRVGTATLHYAGHHLGGASIEVTDDVFRPPIEVAMTTLDDWIAHSRFPRPISFIKCDVESHELSVFRGGQQLLTTDMPTLLFESTNMHDGREHNGKVFDFLASLGYEGYFFDEKALTPLDEFNPAHHLSPEGNENFVFSHRSRVSWQSLVRPYRVNDTNVKTRSAA